MQCKSFLKKGKSQIVRFALSLGCALAFGMCVAETCITADEHNHVQNGGAPLPGTTTQSVASSADAIRAATTNTAPTQSTRRFSLRSARRT